MADAGSAQRRPWQPPAAGGRRRPARCHRSWSLVAALVVCCHLITAARAESPGSPTVNAISSRQTAALGLLPTRSTLLSARALQASTRRKDEYDDDYGDDDDYDDDYDYYGTKQKKKKKKPSSSAAAASAASEINLNNMVNFVRIMVLRIVWGFASMFGLDEPLSEVFNGAFVPPGVEVDDDGLGFDY